MKKKYTNLFFDLDDTLWDTAANSLESMKEIYLIYNFENYYSSFDNFYTVYLKHNNRLWDQYSKGLLKKEELTRSRFYTLFEKHNAFSIEKSEQINSDYMAKTSMKRKTIDGAIDLLNKLNGEYKLHIITNGFKEVQYTKLKQSGLYHFFDQIILSDEAGVNKPNPKIFDYALKKANAEKEESLMIGDMLDTDIKGAHACGIDQVWFNPHHQEIKDIKPTYEISRIDELMKILD
ncbi:YjjG family noncanonical pyrimidine nucleotidase [Dysgonomonas sp. 520]|uniref:YjjG family noncanonical pyrimidine nucleotidase n=1 Tax=Dysgonomonas sp. 520 TaxID=2302931 RepID=UPI0013D4F9F0|nr:YjjG family noncanonical pyrimidine nucleotidase [Dysgonomonas sp. 520]